MPNIDEDAKAWQLELAGRIGGEVRRRRKHLGLTALELAARTELLGYPISRVAISKIESNSRSGKLDVSELLILALALETSPTELVYPNLPHGMVRLSPASEPIAEQVAALGFAAERDLRPYLLHEGLLEQKSPPTEIHNESMALVRELMEASNDISRAYVDSRDSVDEKQSTAADAALTRAWSRQLRVLQRMVARGMPVSERVVSLSERRSGDPWPGEDELGGPPNA